MDEDIAFYILTTIIAFTCLAFFYWIFRRQYNFEKNEYEIKAQEGYPSFLKWLTMQGEYGTKAHGLESHMNEKKNGFGILGIILFFLLMLDFFTGARVISELIDILEKIE